MIAALSVCALAGSALAQPHGPLDGAEVTGTGQRDTSSAPEQIDTPPLAFTEEALERGVDYEVSGVNILTGSAAFVDLDGDKRADIVAVGAADDHVGIFENIGGGQFADRSAESGIPELSKGAGICAADYDADGDLDLFISRVLKDDVLLRNDGNFQFTDVTDSVGVAGNLGAGGGAAWGDYNGDGWPDLYVANRTGTRFPDQTESEVENRLYRNDEGKGFTDVAQDLGVSDGDAPTLTSAFFDYDRDGDADIHLGTDKGNGCIIQQDRTFENQGGAFADVTEETNTASCTDTMGIAIGDFDGNMLPDMYTTNTPPGNSLMMQEELRSFSYRAKEAGVASYALSWGAMFFDYDNDQQHELYVCNSSIENRLYDPSGGWPAENLAEELNLDHDGPSYNISAADIDLDGDLDLLLQDSPGRLRLLINHEGDRRNWIRLRVAGPHPNLGGIGAIVRVRNGDTWQTREVLAGGNNYRSQSELPLTFGLGLGTEQADEIVVDWPSGESRTFTGYLARKEWTLMPPQNLGDGDGDGLIEVGEMIEMIEAMGDRIEPGQEHLDFNGDAVIDHRDWSAMVGKVKAGG